MKPIKSIALTALASGFSLPEEAISRYLELTFLKRLLDRLKITCVIDAGANIGQFASELRKIGYDGYIVSFEPQRREFESMQHALAADRKWRGYRLALGSRSSRMELNVFTNLTVMSSLLQPNSRQKDVGVESVQVKRLDEVFPDATVGMDTSRTFLKMDTQGYDLEVFKGASGCLESVTGLQSELSVRPLYDGMPHYLESLSAYEAAGFELFNLSLVSRTEDLGIRELNCFMSRVKP